MTAKELNRYAGIILIFALAVFAFLVIINAMQSKDYEKATFVIILDGFRSDYLNRTHILAGLTEKWSANISAVTVMPSITPAAHASMITGVDPEVHGIDDYSGKDLKTPSIILYLRERGIKTCAFVGKTYLAFLIKEADYGFDTVLKNAGKENLSEIDVKTLKKAAEWYREGRCGFYIINLASTDLIGHNYGPDSEEVSEQLTKLDNSLSEFLGIVGGSRVIITADHGMCARDGRGYHGTNESCSMRVPLIISSETLSNESVASVKDVYRLVKKIYDS
jgi:predicted AlkP superfamily pyrophosphatase or phosphodiesterase